MPTDHRSRWRFQLLPTLAFTGLGAIIGVANVARMRPSNLWDALIPTAVAALAGVILGGFVQRRR